MTPSQDIKDSFEESLKLSSQETNTHKQLDTRKSTAVLSVDRVEDRRLRRGAGANVSVYYYVGDAYRDMLVAVGFQLGSIVCIIAFAAFNQITVLTACINILFKVLAPSVCYVATAKHSGKVMIFAAICSGLGVAASGYFAISSFTNWASKDFCGVGVPLIVQGILELLVYGHMTYYAVTLL